MTISLVDTPFPVLGMRRLETILGRSRSDLHRIADGASRFYQPFTITKADGQSRTIDRPVGELKAVQGLIQARLLNKLTLPDTMFGGIKGRSPKKNARLHLNESVVVTLDLRECFPRTPNSKIFAVFKGTLGCSTEIANLLTRITTVNGHLPQGAPTSTTLCNLSLLPLNAELDSIASPRSLIFSQYIDDVALSGKKSRDAIELVVQAARKNGYPIRCKKKKIMSSGRRQAITGIIVNRKLSITRDRFEDIRRELIQAAKGDRVAAPVINRLRGLIAHANYINPNQGRALARFAARAIAGW